VVAIGVCIGAIGIGLAINLFGSADLLANSARTLPSTQYADSPVTWRMFGLGFVIGGIVCAVVGVRTGA
jgi:hypothetical protein